MKDAGDTYRQWKITLEYFPAADWEDTKYYFEVREAGYLLDCGTSSDPVIALEDAGQIVSNQL